MTLLAPPPPPPTAPPAPGPGPGGDVPVIPEQHRTPADSAFRAVLVACSSTVLIAIAFIVLYLILRAGKAWHYQGLALFFRDAWAPRGAPASFGFLGDLVGSGIIAMVALVVAVPISLATALAINEYAPRRVRRPLTALVDLLAALPSLVFGMWGKYFLDQHLHLTTAWLGRHASFFPPFRLQGPNVGFSLFVSGLVVGIMVVPIITSISREVMSQVPRDQCEAALALGGTRWGMVTDVIFPFSRNGIVGGAMLGLGRALGETIAVSVVLLSNDRLTSHILVPGQGGSIAALIVREFNGSSPLEQSALMAAGLALFAITLSVNLGARAIVGRSAARVAS